MMTRIKFAIVEMDWTDTGCRMLASGLTRALVRCPVCGVAPPDGVEHLCGDRLLRSAPTKPKKGKRQ